MKILETELSTFHMFGLQNLVQHLKKEDAQKELPFFELVAESRLARAFNMSGPLQFMSLNLFLCVCVCFDFRITTLQFFWYSFLLCNEILFDRLTEKIFPISRNLSYVHVWPVS